MLGENIAALRKQRGMSQQTLADALFVTRQTISKWEKNLSVPDADALVRLADALETTVQALLGQPEEAPAEPGEIAAALSRINDQLAIQNRRRSRIWKAVAWVLGLYAAFHILLLVLGYAGTVQYAEEATVITESQAILLECPLKRAGAPTRSGFCDAWFQMVSSSVSIRGSGGAPSGTASRRPSQMTSCQRPSLYPVRGNTPSSVKPKRRCSAMLAGLGSVTQE